MESDAVSGLDLMTQRDREYNSSELHHSPPASREEIDSKQSKFKNLHNKKRLGIISMEKKK